MENTRSIYESGTDKRVPSNYHPATGSYSHGDGLPGLPDVDTIIESIDFFLAATKPHGVKRKRPNDVSALDHKITKRQCRVESCSFRETKRSCHELSRNVPRRSTHKRIVIKLNDGDGSTSTGSVDAWNEYRNTDTSLENDITPDVNQEDSYNDTDIDIYKHAYCYCGEPRKVITPLRREMPTAEPMRRNLLKKLTMAAAGGGNVCCPRYCYCYWQRVSGYAVYRDN